MIDSIRARKTARSFVDDGGKTKAAGTGESGKQQSRNRVSYPQTKLSPRSRPNLNFSLVKTPRHRSKSLRNGQSKVRSRLSIRLEEIQWTFLPVRGGDAPPLICSAPVRALFLTRTGQRITRPVYWAS